MQSWKDLVQVNGSFYCNLSSTAELDDDDQPDSGSAADWLANGQGIDEPIYLNTLGRTIVRVGDDVTTTDEVADVGQTGDATTTVPVSQQQQQHTIKLVIGGEPLSLDTSEYVSWDGGSQVGNDQSSPSTDGCSVLDEDCDSISSPAADSSSSTSSTTSSPSKPLQLPSLQPIHSDRVYNDELTHSCCRFFAERQLRHLSIANTTTTSPPTVTVTPRQTETHSSGLEDKMQTLRREIVSLVNQDDALFRQLLALNTSIRQLRSQSLQRRVRTLPGSGSSNSNGRTRNQLCPSPSTASLTSFTSMSDSEDDQEEDDEDDGEEEEEGQSSSSVAALLAQSEKKSMPTAGPVLPTANHPAITALQQQLQQHQQQQQQQQQLTRKRISYPPNGRNRSNSQLSRCSFNSSSSTSSSSSSASTTGGSSPATLPASTWSAGAIAIEAPSAVTKLVKAASRTPRSPHSSFYTRVSVKTHQQQQQKQQAKLLAVDHQLQLQLQQQQQSNNDLQPMGVHKRQGSYDSGCQGSEPSDAEVFV